MKEIATMIASCAATVGRLTVAVDPVVVLDGSA
jgi:hypothetical protein